MLRWTGRGRMNRIDSTVIYRHLFQLLRSVMRNRCSAAHRCAAEAIYVCHEIFTSHYNYNHNEINNCLSCFLLCLSFNFLYYSRADRGQTGSTKWNWKVTPPSPPPPPPPQYAKWGWCAAMTLRQYLVCRECRKFAQHWLRCVNELERIR
jgi:hypothetical protein